MKSIAKNASFVGYYEFDGERFYSWTCSNKLCGMPVSDEYHYCPFCGQKLKYQLPKGKLKMRSFSIPNKLRMRSRLTSYDQYGNVLINEEEKLMEEQGCYCMEDMQQIMRNLARRLALYEDEYFGTLVQISGIKLPKEAVENVHDS